MVWRCAACSSERLAGTDYQNPSARIMIRSTNPVIRINTPHGQFTAGLEGGTFLNGRVRVERVHSPVRLSAEDRENEHVSLVEDLGTICGSAG